MLKKILKYDLEYLYKGLVIFYFLAIFFSVITRLFLNVHNSFVFNIIGKICSGVTISMIFNILINNVIRLWIRFKTNLYGDESYLTHTLPITKEKLLLSKTLTAIISLFTSVLCIIISLFIAFYSKGLLEAINKILLQVAQILDSTTIMLVFAFFFVLFLEILNMIQCGYTGIILGHRRNNNKTFSSIVMGFITYLLTQVFVLIIVFVVALFNRELMNLFITVDTLSLAMVKLCVALSILGYFIINLIELFINVLIFKKGVNVD